jgi:hypothetical protein
MPKTFIIQIDSERGDVPRSRFIQKLIEVGVVGKRKEKEGHGSQQVQPSLVAVTTPMEETTNDN